MGESRNMHLYFVCIKAIPSSVMLHLYCWLNLYKSAFKIKSNTNCIWPHGQPSPPKSTPSPPLGQWKFWVRACTHSLKSTTCPSILIVMCSYVPPVWLNARFINRFTKKEEIKTPVGQFMIKLCSLPWIQLTLYSQPNMIDFFHLRFVLMR